MPPLTCGEVRRYLAGLSSGAAVPIEASDWQSLAEKGAVTGSPTSAQLTPVGKHVLKELELRASRTDALTLDFVAAQLTRVLGDLDGVAKTAEYFLAELGPVTPPEAVPLLRPVAVGLANRRETPEELAEEFRNVWGSVEVMGGDPRDRLTAAELLLSADANIEKIYSPMMTTAASVRELAGPKAPAVTIAALLHLNPNAEGKVPYAEYVALRKTATAEEGAAILAATGLGVEEVVRRRAEFLARIATAGSPTPDQQVVAGYLTVAGADPNRAVPRAQTLLTALAPRLPGAGALAGALALADWLEVPELLDWVEKASEIARNRKLAPTGAELVVLGTSMVLGMPSAEFGAPPSGSRPTLVHLANLVALNAWVYAKLVPPAPASTLTPA